MDFLLYLALIPALAVAAQWIAWRTNLPGILLLLLIGVVLGNFIRPDDLLAALVNGDPATTGPRILFPLVSLAVAIIMLEGGLSLKFSELREAGSPALRLCTIGAAVTAVGTTTAAHYCFGFDWRLSALLGAILVVTGPTVIGPLLQQVKPSRRVANTLKWEGIVIDPIGAVLAVLNECARDFRAPLALVGEPGARQQIAQAQVAGARGAQQEHARRLVGGRLALHPAIGADHRLHAGGARRLVELDHAEDVRAVGEGQRRHAVLRRALDPPVEPDDAIRHRILAVQAKMDKSGVRRVHRLGQRFRHHAILLRGRSPVAAFELNSLAD